MIILVLHFRNTIAVGTVLESMIRVNAMWACQWSTTSHKGQNRTRLTAGLLSVLRTRVERAFVIQITALSACTPCLLRIGKFAVVFHHLAKDLDVHSQRNGAVQMSSPTLLLPFVASNKVPVFGNKAVIRNFASQASMMRT